MTRRAGILPADPQRRDWFNPRDLCHLLHRPGQADAAGREPAREDGGFGMAVAQLVQFCLALG